MKKLLFISFMLLPFSVFATTEKINYELVMEAKFKRMGNYLIRYIVTLKSTCIGNLQSLESDNKNNWSIYQTKTLCEIDGKSTATDFADASITGLTFGKDSIHMVVETMPKSTLEYEVRNCTVKVNNGKFSPLHCDKPKSVGN